MGGSASKVTKLEQEVRDLKQTQSTEKTLSERRECIVKMQMGDSELFQSIHFPSRLNVGLFGILGVGKTSLLNSLKFAVKGFMHEMDYEQPAPDQFQGGHTMLRLKVDMTTYLSFIDNRGISPQHLMGEAAKTEIINQLEGKGSFTKNVNWQTPTQSSASSGLMVYCSVVVIDARSSRAMFEPVKRLVEILFEWQGRFPLCMITKVDEATTEDMRTMRSLLQSVGIYDYYEISNITKSKKQLTHDEQKSLLNFIEQCFKYGDRTFQLRDAIKSGK